MIFMEDFEAKIQRYYSELKEGVYKYYDSDFFDSVLEYILSEDDLNKFMPVAKHYKSIHKSTLNLKRVFIEYVSITQSLDKAIKLALNLYREYKNHYQVTFLVAYLMHQKGKHDKAVIFLQRARTMIYTPSSEFIVDVEIEPEDRQEIDLMLGESYYILQSYDKAIFHFELAKDFACENEGDLQMLFDSYCRTQQQERGVSHLIQMDQTYKLDMGVYIAELYQGRGNWETAIEYYTTAMNKGSRYYGERGLKKHADLLRLSGQYQTALTLYLSVYKPSEDPLPNLSQNIGLCYMKQGDADAAIPYFYEAIRVDPLYDEAYGYLAHTLVELKRDKDAFVILRKAFLLGLNHELLFQSLFRLTIQLDCYERTVDFLDQYVEEIDMNQTRLGYFLNIFSQKKVELTDKILSLWPFPSFIVVSGLHIHISAKLFRDQKTDNRVVVFFANGIAMNKEWLTKFEVIYPELAEQSPFRELLKDNTDWV